MNLQADLKVRLYICIGRRRTGFVEADLYVRLRPTS
jgi:hypothetical protein